MVTFTPRGLSAAKLFVVTMLPLFALIASSGRWVSGVPRGIQVLFLLMGAAAVLMGASDLFARVTVRFDARGTQAWIREQSWFGLHKSERTYPVAPNAELALSHAGRGLLVLTSGQEQVPGTAIARIEMSYGAAVRLVRELNAALARQRSGG